MDSNYVPTTAVATLKAPGPTWRRFCGGKTRSTKILSYASAGEFSGSSSCDNLQNMDWEWVKTYCKHQGIIHMCWYCLKLHICFMSKPSTWPTVECTELSSCARCLGRLLVNLTRWQRLHRRGRAGNLNLLVQRIWWVEGGDFKRPEFDLDVLYTQHPKIRNVTTQYIKVYKIIYYFEYSWQPFPLTLLGSQNAASGSSTTIVLVAMLSSSGGWIVIRMYQDISDFSAWTTCREQACYACLNVPGLCLRGVSPTKKKVWKLCVSW